MGVHIITAPRLARAAVANQGEEGAPDRVLLQGSGPQHRWTQRKQLWRRMDCTEGGKPNSWLFNKFI